MAVSSPQIQQLAKLIAAISNGDMKEVAKECAELSLEGGENDELNELRNEVLKLAQKQMEASDFINNLAKGNLFVDAPKKNRLVDPYKELQANLRHLVWQTQEIAGGDYSQHVDFLGDFSKSFNALVEALQEKNRLEEALKSSEEKYRDIFENSIEAIFQSTLDGKLLDVNPTYAQFFGYDSPQEMISTVNSVETELYFRPEDRQLLMDKLYNDGVARNMELRFKKRDGSLFWVLSNSRMVRKANGEPIYLEGSMVDITSRKQAEEEIKLDEARLESLLRINQHSAETIQELLDFALNEAISLTGSKIGYIYFYDESKKEFTLNTWSKEVMQQCKVVEPQTIYQLDKTGIWGEAVRQRRPILVNNFEAPNPLKKGTPEGHAPLLKYLTIPVFSANQIVAVVGVANKPEDYNNSDIRQLNLMMDSVWKIVQRKKAEEALKESEAKFRALFSQMAEGFALHELIYGADKKAIDYRILEINPAFETQVGILAEKANGAVASELYGVSPAPYLDIYARVAETGEHQIFQTYFPPLDRHFEISVFSPNPGYFATVFTDITERKKAEEKIEKLNRLYAVISQVNQAIVHLRDRDRLLDEVCRIAVELGGFQMAWIGLIDEETQLVKPQSVAGAEDGYLSVIKQISVSDNPQGRGPTGTAIREGQYFVCNDIENEPNMILWKADALKRGYRSSISLPFRLQNKVIGAFSLYAGQPHFFDYDEIKLLEEVAFDISYSLGAIETEKEHQKAVAALEESEMRFRMLAESAPVGIVISDKAQNVLFVSNVFSEMFGYTIVDMPDVEAWWPLAYPDVAYRESIIQVWGKALEEVDAKGFIRPIEAVVTCKDGSKKNIECHLGTAGELNFVIFTNITERVKAQHDANERLKEISAFYRLADLTERKGISLDELFQEFSEILPNSWQYSEITFARIIVDGKEFKTANFLEDSKWVQKSPIVINEQVAGSIEVGYLEECPDEDEGPFLKEERMLIDGLAERISHIIERKHIEEALQETKEYLENLIKYANAPIIVWDNNLRITKFNKAFEQLSGRNMPEVLGKEVDILFPDDTREQSLDYIKKASVGERLNVVEIEIQHIDGSIHTLLWNSTAIYSHDKKTIVSTIAQGHDITEQKLSQMALEESERRFRDMMEHVNMVSAMLDIRGNITFANDYLLKLTGWKQEEVIGKNWFDVFVPTDAAVRNDLYRDIEFGKVPVHYENEILTRSGELRLIDWSNSILRNSKGEIEGLAGIGVDITDRKNAEIALWETKNYLENLIKYANAPIIVWDNTFKIKQFNKAFERLTGRNASEVLEKEVEILFPASTRAQSLEYIKKATSGERWEVVEIEIQDSTGNIHTLLWNSAVIYSPDGKTILATIAQGQDITMRKQAEEELKENETRLRELNATKDKFFSIIAHDLKSPFNSILGLSGLLEERVSEKNYEDIGEFATLIRNSSELAYDLLKNLLEWSRSQTGKMEFSPEYLDLVTLINDAFQLLENSARQKSIVVTRRLPKNILAFADRAMVSTILRNLVSNAIKFTKPGGEIIISAQQTTAEIKVTVGDNGVGIRKEELAKLFRIDENHSTLGTKNEKGTGLGLILCKEFIEKHGGRIWAESEFGKGSQFHFTIPKI